MNHTIIASIASIPTREKYLEITINSIIDNVDILHVFLNGYEIVPSFLIHSKIQLYSSDNFGDMADIGKFYPLTKAKGYLFTLDDDLEYPVNYVERMIDKIKYYKYKNFICVHGNLLPSKKLFSYYKEKKGIHFAKELQRDLAVDIPGTGTLAFHSSLYAVDLDHFPSPFMTDIWLYKIAKERNIPVIAISRKHMWIKPLIREISDDSIYARYHMNDAVPTNLINQITCGEL